MKAICFLPSATKRAIADLAIVVKTSGVPFEVCSTPEALSNALEGAGTTRRYLVFADENLIRLPDAARKAIHSCVLVLFLHDHIHAVHETLRSEYPVNCFVAYREESIEPRELVTILSKYRTRTIFGLPRYLLGETPLHTCDIFDESDKRAMLGSLRRFVRNLGKEFSPSTFEEHSKRITSMVDELVINGVFNANPRYRDEPRQNGFRLEEDEAIRVSWGFDGEVFGFSVVDRFGALERETVIQYLRAGCRIVTIKIGNRLRNMRDIEAPHVHLRLVPHALLAS